MLQGRQKEAATNSTARHQKPDLPKDCHNHPDIHNFTRGTPLVYDQNFKGGKGWWMGRGQQ